VLVIREKRPSDHAACLALVRRVHVNDGYPLHMPDDLPGFLTPDYERAAWVAGEGGKIVGHVALHDAAVDPTLEAGQRATGLPADRLTVISRLFVEPQMRRAGVGRALLQTATDHARARGQRALLDVGQTLPGAIALYESQGWVRVEALELRLTDDVVLDLWVYVSPDEDAT
jgi:GNAT superfamily N-acetyltransferase